MINNALREKLKNHKKWLEEQLQREEQEQEQSSPYSQDSETESHSNTGRFRDLSYHNDGKADESDYFMLSAKGQKELSPDQSFSKRPPKNLQSETKHMNNNENIYASYSNESSPSKENFRPIRHHNNKSESKSKKKQSSQESSPSAKSHVCQNKKVLEQRKKLMEEKRDEEEDDSECTFKPKINRKYQGDNTASFLERAKLWNEQKESKISEERRLDESKELKGCTFQPNLLEAHKRIPLNPHNSTMVFKGVDKFVKRYVVARQNKEEKELLLSNPMAKFHLETNPTKKSSVTNAKNTVQQDLRERDTNVRQTNARGTSRGKSKQSEVPFGYAVKKLHNELHQLNIAYEKEI